MSFDIKNLIPGTETWEKLTMAAVFSSAISFAIGKKWTFLNPLHAGFFSSNRVIAAKVSDVIAKYFLNYFDGFKSKEPSHYLLGRIFKMVVEYGAPFALLNRLGYASPLQYFAFIGIDTISREVYSIIRSNTGRVCCKNDILIKADLTIYGPWNS